MRVFSVAVATAVLTLLTSPNWSAELGFRLLEVSGHSVKWGSAELGSGATITYALLDAPARRDGQRNCSSISPIGALLEQAGMKRESFLRELRSAMEMWERVTDVRFVPASSPAKADILIAAETQPVGIAFTDIVPTAPVDTRLGRLTSGAICLNPSLAWTAGDDSSGNVDQQNRIHLRYVLAHELGHILGLDHPGPEGELMSYAYNKNLTALQPGDIAGVTLLYGSGTPSSGLALNIDN